MKLKNRYDLQTYMLNSDDDSFRFGWKQDVSGILERNKIIRDSNEGRRFAADVQHVCSIPAIVYEAWMRDFGLKFPPTPECLAFCEKKCEDPEFKAFRTGAKI